MGVKSIVLGGNDLVLEAQVADAQRLMDEVPRIEAGLKTFLSLAMAKGLVDSAAGGAADGSLRASASTLQGCARALLKALNTLDLPPSPQWALTHPQGDQESGMDFMTRLSSYKVVQILWARVRASGNKPASFLGRSSLRWAFPEVEEKLLGDPASPAAAGANIEEFRAFILGFGATLAQDAADSDLVWAANTTTAVAARQAARQADAADRVQRATTEEVFAAEMRAALSADDSGRVSSVQVEEMND